ncbi:hypothetical protein [Cyanobium sp. NS01]|uniref:hypothetical protein n=1 Tax=Cyanobium sp. NS01 TaxID=261284 RepID=UPI001647EF47|nr:hypothetical protein [Cyanobium sp. NS01]QNI70343.1 putative membrane protein [Cyanobium sp. NS01]
MAALGLSFLPVMGHWSILLCCLATALSLILITSSSTGLRSSDLPYLLLVAMPYWLLGLLACWQRRRQRSSLPVFIAVLIVSFVGIILFGVDSYHFHTVPAHRLVQRFSVITIPLLQSASVLAIAAVLLTMQLCRDGRRSKAAPPGRR